MYSVHYNTKHLAYWTSQCVLCEVESIGTAFSVQCISVHYNTTHLTYWITQCVLGEVHTILVTLETVLLLLLRHVYCQSWTIRYLVRYLLPTMELSESLCGFVKIS